MDAGHVFLLVETAAAIFVSGVLWTMQLLNYPLLALVGAPRPSPATSPRTTAASAWWSSPACWPP